MSYSDNNATPDPHNKKPILAKPAQLEAHKTALVKDMLSKIRPHVDAKGLLKTTDTGDIPAGFCELLASETGLVPRVLLLTLLLHPGHSVAIWSAVKKSAELLDVLDKWFKEAVSEYIKGAKETVERAVDDSASKQPLLLCKLLDLLAVLDMDLDTLLSCKFGKSLKRLVNTDTPLQHPGPPSHGVKDKAQALFHSWSALADQAKELSPIKLHCPMLAEDVGREEDACIVNNKSHHHNTECVVEVVPVGRSMFFGGGGERPVASAAAASTARPMSADDIQREKKRRAYLESIGVSVPTSSVEPVAVVDDQSVQEDHQIPGLAIPAPEEPPVESETPSKKSKTSGKRVSFPDDPELLVQVRRFEPDPEEEHDHATVAALSANEASYAFDRLREVMEADMEWTPPRGLHHADPQHGGPVVRSKFATGEDERERTVLSINYHSVETIPSTPNELPLLVSDEPAKKPRSIPLCDPQGSAPLVRHLHPAAPANQSPATVGGKIPTISPELLSVLLQQQSGAGKEPGGSQSKPTLPPPPPPRPVPAAKPSKQRSRPVCKFYRDGVPGSCRSGSSCPFRHGNGE